MDISEYPNEFLVESLFIAVTKWTGKEYASVALRQKEKTFEGKIWDWAGVPPSLVETGKVILISYTTDVYQGKTQLNIKTVRKGALKPEDLMRKANGSIEGMWSNLVDIVGSFANKSLKKIGEATLEVIPELFREAPAGMKVHGDWVGGLLEHTWSMCKLAGPIVDHFSRYAPLNKDRVLCGIILHDIGKAVEYCRKGGSFFRSRDGVLLGHIGWAVMFLEGIKYQEGNEDLPHEDEVNQIAHIILSHHGRLEYGSPLVPATLEALIVHHIDMLDAHFMHAWDIIGKGPSQDNPDLSQYSRFHNAQYLMQEIRNGGEPTREDEPARNSGEDTQDPASPW
jgi:3'-5' exoribonuclease